MTNPSATPPSSAPPASAPAGARPAVATLSRELSDFLLELSITLNKHTIYPSGHPLLGGAIDGVVNRIQLLFIGGRDSLSIGVARKQLIIEGVATDPQNPVLKELAQRLHNHRVGAVKFLSGIGRDELADALAALAVDPSRSQKPLGLDADASHDRWQHVRFFPLTYDRLQLIEDDETGEPRPNQMAASRSTQLWIGLARAALVTDASDPWEHRDDDEDSAALEPATVARAIDEHQREQAYDQVIVGYLLQIGEELKTAEGPEAVGLQRRVSRLVGSLKQSTLERLLEMGGDKAQRRKFLLDASQGITVEAVIDLVKAASQAEGQTISHSMLRMLSKLAHHPATGGVARGRADPQVRDVMRRLVDDWSLDDPNPEAYRVALEQISSLKVPQGDASAHMAAPTDADPERIVQIAIEVGTTGAQVRGAMADLFRAGRLHTLLDLVERAPSEEAAAPVWEFLVSQQPLDAILRQERVDMPLLNRFVRRLGISAADPLLSHALKVEDAKLRSAFYDLVHSLGNDAGPVIATRVDAAPTPIQRELLKLLGTLGALPPGFSAQKFLSHEDALVRREAVKLLLRDSSSRQAALTAAVSDSDDRVVFVGLMAPPEILPPAAVEIIRRRVDKSELDSKLRTMGIRIVAHRRTQQTLRWLLRFVLTEVRWPRRPKLRPPTPEMLAALGAVASGWRDDPDAARALKLAEASKHADVRARVARARAGETPPGASGDE